MLIHWERAFPEPVVLSESKNKSLKEQNGWKPNTISHQNQLLEVMHKSKTDKIQTL